MYFDWPEEDGVPYLGVMSLSCALNYYLFAWYWLGVF